MSTLENMQTIFPAQDSKNLARWTLGYVNKDEPKSDPSLT